MVLCSDTVLRGERLNLMDCPTVMAVLIDNRSQAALRVQEALTRNGCIINARLGLHDAGPACSEQGLLLLHLCGSAEDVAALEADLATIPGVKAKSMRLDF